MHILLISNQVEAMERQKLSIAEHTGADGIRCCRPGLELLDATEDFVPDLAVLQAGGHFFDLGIVDHLKKINRLVYIIFVAGVEEQELLERALEAGVDDFIAGPPSDGELILRVKKGLLRETQKRRRTGSGSASEPRRAAAAKRSPLVEAAKVAGNIAFGVLITLMALLAFFLVQSKYVGGVPSVFGYRIYAVLSGSMNPAFDTGSVVFVRPAGPQTIAVGDIITFSGSSSDLLTTHRVVDINSENGLEFTTRGDANNVDDPNPVPAANVIGRVHGSVPHLGYLMGFARTRQGLVVLVFIPSLLVIAFEIRNILQALGGSARGRRESAKTAGELRTFYR